MVRVRSSLAELPAYVPGRKAPGAAALASNESPYGLLPGVAGRLAELAGGVSRYPDMGATALVRAIAAHHGVEPDRIAVGAGSSEVCGQLLHSVVGPGDEVVFGWRSFEAYPILTAVAGGTAVKIPLRDHTLDLDAMAAAVTGRTRLVFVCNPNNPTSTAVGERALRDFADRVPQDVLIVVDEAYREYADPERVPDALGLLGDRPNVVVLRTFSKAYALAGLRVGYCVAPMEIAAQVRKTQVPFSVSALAQEAAVVALGECPEVARRAALTVAEREGTALRLRALGFEVPQSQANFVWLPLAGDSADFARHCLDGKVVVRPFLGEGVRVTIGLPEENDAFLALAATWRG
ncbi:histidinol-phosphate transaminase [Streptomyces sp. NPDC002896]|uniref:histidinol-phosphate transaminase n=1 Tax=Streptomyces sp. NPDC002896 TaxID=3154438 RepID=UPI003330EB53